MKKFQTLLAKLREIKAITDLTNLAVWDQQVNMPARGAKDRGDQLALLAALQHKRASSDELFDLSSELTREPSLTGEEKLVAQRVHEDIVRARKRPRELVSAIARKESETHQRWLEAREERNFHVVAKPLSEMVALKQDYAQAIAPSLSKYDALLDDFEKGSREKVISERFEILKAGALKLREKFLYEGEITPIQIPGSETEQAIFFKAVAEDLGFDFSRGRLDGTVHPFASEMGTHDVRLTTRYDLNNALFGLPGFIHETGHGLYEQGLRESWAGTPLAQACSLAIHESQSLFYEKQLACSLEFQSYLLHRLQEFFPNQAATLSSKKLFREFNGLSINLLRLSSEEIGYALHIILRFEIERGIVNGEYLTEDIPAIWREKTISYFGRSPGDDLEGALQDVHWYSGAWGYFPHYLGGAMYAAQLMQAFKHEHPEPLNNKQQFGLLLEWLGKMVHQKGRSLDAEELIKSATGTTTDADAYLNYLNEKCKKLMTLG